MKELWAFVQVPLNLLLSCQDLEHAKWAEIPKDAYMAAARFLVTHNVAYQNLDVNEDAAHEHFLKLGEAVKAQAVSIVVEEALPAKLPGPAELSDEIVPENMEESTLTRSGEDEGTLQQPEHDFEENEDEDQETLPALHCVAAEVTSADPDVERSCKELAAKIIFLMKKGGKNASTLEAEVESLQGTVASMSQAELQQRIDDLVRSMDEAEGRLPARLGCHVMFILEYVCVCVVFVCNGAHEKKVGLATHVKVCRGRSVFEASPGGVHRFGTPVHVSCRVLAEVLSGAVSIWRWRFRYSPRDASDFARVGCLPVGACGVGV